MYTATPSLAEASESSELLSPPKTELPTASRRASLSGHLFKKRPKPAVTDPSLLIPTRLAVIRCMKRFKCHALKPEIHLSKQARIRNYYTAHSRMPVNLSKLIQERKDSMGVSLPKDRYTMGVLIKNMKETDRILRQEPDFLAKIREIKPEIELKRNRRPRTAHYIHRKSAPPAQRMFPEPPKKILMSFLTLREP